MKEIFGIWSYLELPCRTNGETEGQTRTNTQCGHVADGSRSIVLPVGRT